MPGRRHKADKGRIEAREKQRRALELRKQGLNYQQIADHPDIRWPNRSYACRYVMRELRDLPKEAANELRQLEMERLDTLTSAVWTQALAGDGRAVETVLKLMERRSRLLGLDSPHKISHGAEEGISMIGSLMLAIREADGEEDPETDDDPEVGQGTDAGEIADE